MRHLQATEILLGTDLSGDINGKVLDIANLDTGSISLTWTGSPVGDFKVQVSDDELKNPLDPDYTDLTWIDVSTQAAGGAGGSHRFKITDEGARWLTVVFSSTSGTGTVTVHNATFKGVK